MKIYKKLFQYVSKYKIVAYLSIIISSISAIYLVISYYFMYLFLKETIINNNYNNAVFYAIIITSLLTLSAILYLISGIVSHKFAFRLETNLRKKGIDGLTDASFRFYDINSSGYIRKTIDDNAAKTHTAVAHMLPDNSQAILIPLLTIILSFIISIKVGIVITVLTLVSGIILKSMMGNAEFMKLYQTSLDKLSEETVEYVRGMQVIKIFRTKLKAFKALHSAINDYSKYAYNYSLSCKRPYVIYQLIFIGLIALLTIPLVFFLGNFQYPKLLAIDLIMIFFLSGVIMVSFMKIMWASMNIFNANYAVSSLENLYQKMREDKLSYGTKEDFNNSVIEFKEVSFSYGDNKVIDKLSLKLEENKIYALVGHSGSGKSTIAKLLSGFYKVDEGSISIGDYNLEEYTKEALIKNIAFVFQDTKLYKKTIYENVAMANEKASKEEVFEAIKLAGCLEIINKFKDKENTMIGSKGIYLSGGEKQRIAIARAILKKAKIVILDEASAAIDADNEYELQKAFKNLIKDKTVIMIAHRITSIKNVDEIIVLENGKIVEQGKNEELLKKQGKYSHLVKLYETANEWRITNEEIL